MKNKLILTIALLLIGLNINYTNANIINVGSNNITIYQNKDINKKDMFIFFANYYNSNIPNSYKYINVGFTDVIKNSKLEKALQKLIYLDLINNPKRELKPNGKISAWGFFRLSEKVLKIKINDRESKENLLKRNANLNDLMTIKKFLKNDSIEIELGNPTGKQLLEKEAILNDVYKTLIYQYYGKDNLSRVELLNSAIEGLTKGTEDKHTAYFPPVKNKSFQDFLSGEYEGIGAYVDMKKPGVLEITSPIPGSPSEKAGLKGGDIITKVDGKEIKKDNSLLEIVSWIKGPAGTNVVLTINRKGKIKDITVTRDKIIITDIETKKIGSYVYYIHIKSFGENVSSEFKKSLDELKSNKYIDKIIIDLRNDGGGYLDQVTEILSYFVPKGENTAVVKYLNRKKAYVSRGYTDIDFSKYKIVILQNSGTASASEILIGTLKDYYNDITIIGEQSYGKGSVQTMKKYSDGSMLKYTIAKWFTGGSETGIDGVGITPDIELEFDYEKFKKYGTDNQMEKAKYLK